MSCAHIRQPHATQTNAERAHGVDVLALELGEEALEARVVRLDADGLEHLLHVRRGRRRVPAGLEEEVCRDVLHLRPISLYTPASH
jgi:hypothetical protein